MNTRLCHFSCQKWTFGQKTMDSWLNEELSGCAFKDQRLTTRFKSIVACLSEKSGKSIPEICEEWASTKAFYRFLSNERVEASEILAGHFEQTMSRVKSIKGPCLVLHDTTEFIYNRKKPLSNNSSPLSSTNKQYDVGFGKDYKTGSILLQASLAITLEGLPLGLTSTKFWTRKGSDPDKELKKKNSPTCMPAEAKESIKWQESLNTTHKLLGCHASKVIHVSDRESDIYDYMCNCHELNAYFIVRSSVNRLTEESTLVDEVALTKRAFKHMINYQDANGNNIEATLNIKIKQLKIKASRNNKQSCYPELPITVVSAVEVDRPVDREPIKWTFLTNLPVSNKEESLSVIDWYKQRWKIEVYFKVLKCGLKVEESKLRTAERLTRLIAICCILAWRIHWLTMLNREDRRLAPKLAFDNVERLILENYIKKKKPETLQDYILRLAKLGGYLARSNDPPPGNTVIWRGLNRLYELKAGFELAQNCG
ncbi:IS4 family transposase [Zooshikella ganghwensis]|uniref:IS4 family transposase n=2 Tax=Zooshikella ganghwensis TaxID=202772 RepID=A0A4P9VGS7_9GAMM|nr:IS4 family transposase [Zooshikella ganghwensis]